MVASLTSPFALVLILADLHAIVGIERKCQCDAQAWEMAKWEISYFWLHAEELLRCKLTPGCEGDGLPQGIWDAMPCNRELLYQVDATMACAIGMMHLMTACVLKMWAEAQYRQSSLYFDQALGFLVLSLDCEEQHTYEWPISTSMILGNYNRFIAAAFPSGPLRIEHRDGYDAAGPIVRKNAFQWRTHETWLSCPEEPAAKPPQNISVACLVPVMWPAEKESYDVIRETWGAECDAIYFFVAVAEGAELPEDVVNLSSFFPSIIHDAVASKLDGNQRPRASGANQKDLLLFAWAAEYLGAFDWFCRIETDGYFSTENFKRMAPEDHKNQAIFLGATMLWTTHFEPRLIVQEQPQCLSSKALHRLHNVVARASWTESPSYLECELAPGHRGDLVLALCLNDAFVTPKISVDARGRDFFVAYPWESQRHYRPEEHAVIPDPRQYDSDGQQTWKGKAHIYIPCWKRNTYWISPYAVSFHWYKNPAELRAFHETFHKTFGKNVSREYPVNEHESAT